MMCWAMTWLLSFETVQCTVRKPPEKRDWNLFSLKVVRALLLTSTMPRICLQNTDFGEQIQGFPLEAGPLTMPGLWSQHSRPLKTKQMRKQRIRWGDFSLSSPCWVVCLSLRAEQQSRRAWRVLEWPIAVSLAELQTENVDQKPVEGN